MKNSTSKMPTELYESGFATADAAGKTIVRLQPLRAFERWHVTGMAVSSTSTTKIPTVKVYKGSESPSMMIANSYNGQLNYTESDFWLNNGVALLAVWELGDVGSRCVFTIEGEKVRRG